jgi:membrane protein
MKALRNLLTTPTVQLGRTARFFVFQCKLWSHCFRLLIKNRAAPLAAALSYYSIFGIVPLAIVAVLIFHSVPAYREIGGQLKRITYGELHLTSIEYPNPDNPEEQIVLTDYVDTIINRFFTGLDKGSLGLISAVLVIWAALRLLSIIESAFNHMWSVPRGRRFLHRMINYWAVLTLGPLLLATGLYATTTYTMLGSIETGILATIGPIVSYLVSLLALFLLYLVMPNAKVRPGAALWGAGVAALVLSLAKWGFGIYVTELIPYSKAYGVLGLIPLGVFWVYVTWVIVLLGLQLTFTIQHFDTLEMTAGLKAQEADGPFIANDVTAIAIARELAGAFDDDRGPVSADEIGRRLGIPATLGRRLLDELVRRDLLVRTSRPRQGFLLARDPRRIRLSDLAEAVAAVSFGQPIPDRHDALRQIVDEKNHLLAQHTLKELLRRPAATTDGPSQVNETSASQDDRPDEQASPSPTA